MVWWFIWTYCCNQKTLLIINSESNFISSFLFVLLYGPHITIKCCLRGQKNNTPAIINCTQKLKGWLRTLCDFAQHDVNWVQTEQEQTDRKEARWRRCESGTESWCYCPAGLVISQMAGSISSPWKGQHSKLQDLPTGPGKRDKKGKKIKFKKKSHIYRVHLLGRGTARKGFLIDSCTCGPGLEQSDNSSEYRLSQDI